MRFLTIVDKKTNLTLINKMKMMNMNTNTNTIMIVKLIQVEKKVRLIPNKRKKTLKIWKITLKEKAAKNHNLRKNKNLSQVTQMNTLL